jgi:hypothetical protein
VCRDALEPLLWRGLLWFVHAPVTSRYVAIGGVAAGATTGALIAIGHRLGGVGLPFRAIGAVLLPNVSGAALVLLGVLLHVAVMVAWSWCFIWLVRRLEHTLISALVIALVHFVVSGVVARVSGNGLASALLLGDRIVFALVFAASLVVGMRFALPPLRNA